MNVLINGEKREVPERVNLKALLELFSMPSRRIAVEVNRNVIRRAEWETLILDENDRIEVIHFVGGG
jgi:sulfur carrier protein